MAGNNNRKTEGGTIYKGKEEQRTHNQTGELATPHLVPQRDGTTPAIHYGIRPFHNLLKYALKGGEK